MSEGSFVVPVPWASSAHDVDIELSISHVRVQSRNKPAERIDAPLPSAMVPADVETATVKFSSKRGGVVVRAARVAAFADAETGLAAEAEALWARGGGDLGSSRSKDAFVADVVAAGLARLASTPRGPQPEEDML